MKRRLALVLVVCSLGSLQTTLGGNWPQFRGPKGSGLGTGTHLPTEIGPDRNVLWRTEIPGGVSSPCIWDDRIYVTAYKKADQALALYCLDRKTGRILFERNPKAKAIEGVHRISSPASATPTTDGERVYVFFGSIGLLAYDMDGKELWRVPLGPFTFLFDWGEAASPVLCGDAVIQSCDNDGLSFLISVDRQTGKVNWRTDRPLASVSYSSPVIWDTPEGRRIVIAGSGRLNYYDPETGKEIAVVRGLPRIVNPTPVISDGILYLAGWTRGETSRNIIQVLLTFKDDNKDGKISREELPESFGAQFEAGDENQDGVLAGEELKKTFSQGNEIPGGGSVLMAVRPGGSGDITQSHVLWTYDRGVPYVPSPLVVNGRMHVIKDGGIASCFDIKTGRNLYQERVGSVGAYYASPVTADGKIYVASERGVITVIAEGPTFKKLWQVDMGEGIMATPAILDGRIYLRTDTAVYCFGTK